MSPSLRAPGELGEWVLRTTVGRHNVRYPNRIFEKLGLVSLAQMHAAESGGCKLIAFPAR